MSTSCREPACSRFLIAGALLLCAGCDLGSLWDQYPFQARVPVTDVGAQFLIADATWFEEEETLFIFYRVDSLQGLSDASEIELAYRTDDTEQDFIHLEELEPVHEHVRADCGPRTICGSYSIAVEQIPRDVQLRLRYHRDGELTLPAPLAYHVVLTGLPHESRSAILYGVFDETNTHVQWRLRHLFPAIRNQEAEDLGLRRYFRVEDVRFGTVNEIVDGRATNPYGYGLLRGCPPAFGALESDPVETTDRAAFDPTALPVESYASPHLCGRATVTDATGEFTRPALAQKNPETRPAFAALRTPVTENTLVPFMLDVCGHSTFEGHREMQMQRLFLDESDVICIDDYATTDFPARLAARLLEDINAVRPRGEDMVLTIALNRPDDPEVAARVEEALALIVPPENEQGSPRVSGAFVYDTAAYAMASAELSRVVLWCPANTGADLDGIPDTSQRVCATRPIQDLTLGELRLSQLPILPTEAQFETFVEKYGAGQVGSMKDVTIRAPTRTAATENVPVQDFGIATFFNEEAITPEPEDAFSYCADEDSGFVVFRVPGFPDVFPLSVIGQVHAALHLERYELGLFWDFPFLVHIEYEAKLAAATDVPELDFVIGFGIASPAEEYYGGFQWEEDEFVIEEALLQCTRFCDHPTFDSAGVYNVDDLFVTGYADRCYRPHYPALGDDGFPIDP